MEEVRDPQGAEWSVQRCWWPSPGSPDLGGLDVEGLFIGVALRLAALVSWPLWFLAKLCGVRWRIVIKRDGEIVRTEKIRGWSASGQRIEEIAQSLRGKVASGMLTTRLV